MEIRIILHSVNRIYYLVLQLWCGQVCEHLWKKRHENCFDFFSADKRKNCENLLEDKVVCTPQLHIAQLVPVDCPQQQPPGFQKITLNKESMWTNLEKSGTRIRATL